MSDLLQLRRCFAASHAIEFVNGLRNGQYYSPSSASQAGLTVQDNQITVNKCTSNYRNIDIPLKKPVSLKSGDVLRFSSHDILVGTTSNLPIQLYASGWVGSGLKLNGPNTISKTMTSDITSSTIRVQLTTGHVGAVFTLSMSVNGEVIF